MDIKFLKWVQVEYGYSTIDALIDEYDTIINKFKTITFVKKYTEKSYVVFGNTKVHKDDLKTFGCKWCKTLSQENFDTSNGWIFPSSKLQQFKEQFPNFVLIE